MLSVRVCWSECGMWIVPRRRPQTSFLLLCPKDGNSHFWLFKMDIFFVIRNKTMNKWIKNTHWNTIKLKTRRLPCRHYPLFSTFWYRFALCSLSSTVHVIFLPLHVEKLLILCLWNVVRLLPKWYSFCRIFFFLSCCCVALSSLFCLIKTVKTPPSHTNWYKRQTFKSRLIFLFS